MKQKTHNLMMKRENGLADLFVCFLECAQERVDLAAGESRAGLLRDHPAG